MPSTIKHNKRIVRQFIDAINRQDWAALDALVASGFIRHQAGSSLSVRNHAELKEFLLGEAKTFPDAEERIRILVAEGDRVAAYLTFRGTQSGPLGTLPASGRKLEADFACFFRLEGGKIAEARVVWDALDMLRQLGHIHT